MVPDARQPPYDRVDKTPLAAKNIGYWPPCQQFENTEVTPQTPRLARLSGAFLARATSFPASTLRPNIQEKFYES
jgi:hypothetical protein